MPSTKVKYNELFQEQRESAHFQMVFFENEGKPKEEEIGVYALDWKITNGFFPDDHYDFEVEDQEDVLVTKK